MTAKDILNKPWTREEIRYDRDKVYTPLLRIMRSVRKKLEEFDLAIPIAKIAWMLVRNEINGSRHAALRNDLYNYLKMGNNYRKNYLELKMDSSDYFDKLMKKYHWYAPKSREYKLIRNEIYAPLIMKDKAEEWKGSFRSRSELMVRKFNLDPAKMPEPGVLLDKVTRKYSKKTITLKGIRASLIKSTDDLISALENAAREPGRGWVHARDGGGRR